MTLPGFRVHGIRYQTRDLDPDGNPIELFEPAARS